MTKPPTPVALSNSLTDLEEPFTDFDFNGSDLRWLRCKIRHIAKMPVAAKYYLRAGEIVELEALAACPWDDLIEGIKRLEPYGWSSKNPATISIESSDENAGGLVRLEAECMLGKLLAELEARVGKPIKDNTPLLEADPAECEWRGAAAHAALMAALDVKLAQHSS